jgi:hypothetical protein
LALSRVGRSRIEGQGGRSLTHGKQVTTDKNLVCWTDTEKARNTAADQGMNEKMQNMRIKANKASYLMKERYGVHRTIVVYDKIKAVYDID